MSRYRGPRIKVLRKFIQRTDHRDGNPRVAQLLPGFSTKTVKKQVGPGQHGAMLLRKKSSSYARRLLEKQKLRFNYGVTEKQLIHYVKNALRSKEATGFALLQQLEMRLDTIVFHLGLAPTIPAARQLINHGHIFVNKQKVTISSYQCQPGENISFATENILKIAEKGSGGIAYKTSKKPHLNWDNETNIGLILGFAPRSSISLDINELLVVEFYSRKI